MSSFSINNVLRIMVLVVHIDNVCRNPWFCKGSDLCGGHVICLRRDMLTHDIPRLARRDMFRRRNVKFFIKTAFLFILGIDICIKM